MLNIGSVPLANQVILAPMAGITDPPFRRIVSHFGPGLLCGEMVSAMALHYNSRKTQSMLLVDPVEKPVSIQIFGSDPVIMAEAARCVATAGADLIDINMGCPVAKVVKNGEGAALMNNLPLAAEIVRAVVTAVAIPVTVKFRLGWDDDQIVAPELARIAADCGASAVTLHARTRAQFYQGKADWDWIRRVKEAVSIPVIGNGDVDSPQAARRMLAATGCDGVMIGQAALGRPWLFQQVVSYLETGVIPEEPPLAVKFQIILEHLERQVQYAGPILGPREMRKHLAWYFKGLPGAARMRDLVNTLNTPAAMVEMLREYMAGLGINRDDNARGNLEDD